MYASLSGRCSRRLAGVAAAGLVLTSCSPTTHFFRVVDHTGDVESAQLILCGKDPFFERSKVNSNTLNLKISIACEQNGVVLIAMNKGDTRMSLTPYLPNMYPSTTNIWHVYSDRIETRYIYWDEVSRKWEDSE
jgi:hypothetical protein